MRDTHHPHHAQVGKQGASHAQARSLHSLLEAHGLVKVKVNNNAEAAAVAAQLLAEEAEAVVLQQKGNTLLFASAKAKPEDLNAIATANWEKKAQKQLHKERQRTGIIARVWWYCEGGMYVCWYGVLICTMMCTAM